MYQFSTISFSWIDLNTKIIGTPPCARSYLGFTSLDQRLYVHGGWNGDGVPHSKPCLLDSLMVLTSNVIMAVAVTAMPARPHFKTAVDYIGPGASPAENQLSSPHTRAHRCESTPRAPTTPPPGQILTARPRSGAIADLHAFDPARREWADLCGAGGDAPPARAFHGFAAAAGQLYVFGGWDGYSEPPRH
jgi:hypothetical protein